MTTSRGLACAMVHTGSRTRDAYDVRNNILTSLASFRGIPSLNATSFSTTSDYITRMVKLQSI
jgi:hypothetical protein